MKLKLQDMWFIWIRVHMMEGCVSVGMIAITLAADENCFMLYFILSRDTLQVIRGNFSKCFTTTHIAHLSFSASSQQPTKNTSTPGTRQKEYWHILHYIKCKLKLKDMRFIPIRVHMTQRCVSVGMIPIKPEVKENVCQAFFSLIPWYPPSITGQNKKQMR